MPGEYRRRASESRMDGAISPPQWQAPVTPPGSPAECIAVVGAAARSMRSGRRHLQLADRRRRPGQLAGAQPIHDPLAEEEVAASALADAQPLQAHFTPQGRDGDLEGGAELRGGVDVARV